MAQQYETQRYDLLKTIDKAEIRYYPPVMKIKTARSNGFSALFGYISGDNSTRQKIAMTTPVYMGNDSTGKGVMEFVLPKAMHKDSTPSSLSDSVEVYESESGYFIAYPFGGYAIDWVVQRATNTLREIAHLNKIEIVDEPLLLVYNSPYKLINRKNEVLFQIDPKSLK